MGSVSVSVSVAGSGSGSARVTRGPEEAEGAAEPSRVAYGPIDHVAHVEEGHLSGWARGWGVRAGAAEAPPPRQVEMLWACASRRCVLTMLLPWCRRYKYYGFEPPRAWPCSLKVIEKACGGSSSFLPAVRAS